MKRFCPASRMTWFRDIPGLFHKAGKGEFDREIENPAFQGRPAITITRLTEENDVVIAEGMVRAQKKGGEFLNLVFCDVFEMKSGKIKRLISYLMEVKSSALNVSIFHF